MSVEKIKAAVRARDDHCCATCGMTADQHRQHYGFTLDVHRVVPGSAYSLDPGVCITLCRRCHGPQPRRKRGKGDHPRLTFYIDERIKLAIQLHALKRYGDTRRGAVPRVINAILREALAEEITELLAP